MNKYGDGDLGEPDAPRPVEDMGGDGDRLATQTHVAGLGLVVLGKDGGGSTWLWTW